MLITKASGEQEEFSEEKFRKSLERASVAPDMIETVVGQVVAELKPGMRTADIYRRAFGLLRKRASLAACRYSLKRSIMELGPTGYPFEKLVAALFAAEGFATEVGQVVSGKCVMHEIDVIAQKDSRRIMIECKYHNEPGIKSDVKVALCAWARFQDLGTFNEAWLVTNTKFTDDAVRYAKCVGMNMTGWRYPGEQGLERTIDRLGMHPLTCLTTLSRGHKQRLLEMGFVLSRDLKSAADTLRALGLSEQKIALVMEEVNQL